MAEVSVGAGRRLADRYTLRAPIGRGGMGTVWRADDDMLGRAVAIKEVRPAGPRPDSSDTASVAMRARILREARAAARLDHPSVVTIYDVLQVDGELFIVMELLDTPNLAELIREEGPLAPERAARIGLGILEVLEAAHRSGIVHRDVKPSNIMVLRGDRVKLTDFGIASLQGDPKLTGAHEFLGSPGYTSPEQVAGEPIGPAADLWSLGATLYFAVEGQPPFRRDGVLPTLAAVIDSAPDPMSHGGEIEPVIRSLLAKPPQDRPTHNALRRSLKAVVAAVPDPAEDPPAEAPPGVSASEIPPAPVRRRRSRGLVVFGLVPALVVALAAGTFVMLQGGHLTGGQGNGAAPKAPSSASGTSLSNQQATGPSAGDATGAGGGSAAIGSTTTVLAPPTTQGAGQPPPGWSSYGDPQGLYSFVYPVGWAPSYGGSSENSATITAPNLGNTRIMVYAHAADARSPVTVLRDYAAIVSNVDRTIQPPSPSTFHGDPAAVWEVILGFSDGTKGHLLIIDFVKGAHRYSLQFQAQDTVAAWQAMLRVMTTVERSFRTS